MHALMEEGDRRYPGWRVVLACAVGAFCASAPYQAFAVFLKPIVAEFSWSREAASAAYGMMALLAAAAAAPVGRLLDRRGARPIVIASLTLSGLGVASLALLTPSLAHLYIVCGVIGVATIGASPVAYSRAIFSWFDRHRGRALGLMLSGAALAAVVQAPIATALINAVGWRAAWLAFGTLTLAVGVPLVTRLMHERKDDVSAASRLQGASLPEALSTRRFWTLIAVILGSGLLGTGVLVHMAALLTDRGIGAGMAAVVLSTMGAANLAGRLLTGYLLDRYHAPHIAALLLTISGAGGLILSRADSIEVAMLAAVMIGLGTGGEMDVNPYLLSRYFGMRSLSTLYGFNWMALGVASAVGPVLMGRAHDATGTYASILVRLAMVTFAAAMLMLTLRAPLAASAWRPNHENRVA